MFNKRCLVKSANLTSWSEGFERTLSGWHLQEDDRCVQLGLDKSGMSQSKAMVTRGCNEAISAATAAGGKDGAILCSSEHHDGRSMVGLFQCMIEMKYGISWETKEVMQRAPSPTSGSLQDVKTIAACLFRTTKFQAQFPMV